MSEKDRIAKLERLVKQLEGSEDPDCCVNCGEGKHMDCPAEDGPNHVSQGCACEFCCA